VAALAWQVLCQRAGLTRDSCDGYDGNFETI
jgi:hypothetical protein